MVQNECKCAENGPPQPQMEERSGQRNASQGPGGIKYNLLPINTVICVLITCPKDLGKI